MFLLTTPVIGGAALLKLPPLLGAQGNGLPGPLLVGSVPRSWRPTSPRASSSGISRTRP
ncbi:hypothetical protein ACWEO4_39670 [Streptomyces sp. NPDC004393]